jgi:hypothetical protein
MHKTLRLTFAALAVVSSSAFAEKPAAEAAVVEVKGEAGRAVAAEVEIQATIVVLDPKTRNVVVRLQDGTTRSFTVSEEARNLDQAKVGDILTLRYLEALALKLEKAPGAKPGKTVSETVSRAKEGDKPGGTMRRTVTVVGTVSAVDEKGGVVTVVGPEDGVVDIKVQDPAKLAEAKVKKGDLVRATFTEALVVSVSPPAKAGATK